MLLQNPYVLNHGCFLLRCSHSIRSGHHSFAQTDDDSGNKYNNNNNNNNKRIYLAVTHVRPSGFGREISYGYRRMYTLYAEKCADSPRPGPIALFFITISLACVTTTTTTTVPPVKRVTRSPQRNLLTHTLYIPTLPLCAARLYIIFIYTRTLLLYTTYTLIVVDIYI